MGALRLESVMPDKTPLLQAIHVSARKLASSDRFDAVLNDVLGICVDAVGASGGTIYLHDPDTNRLVFRHVLPENVAEKMPFPDIPDDFGVAGRVFQTRKTEISHFEESKESDRSKIEKATGVFVSTMITVPLMMEGEQPIGVVQLINKKSGKFDNDDATVLDTVSAISTMAYLNSRLLDESTRSSQLLGMGKVAHDIKNLAFALEANVSFSDQTLNHLRKHARETHDKTTEEFVETIEAMFDELNLSIDRVKRYSTLMSDLSAGKPLQPAKKLAPLAGTIELSAAYLESEARKSGIALNYDIQQDAPPLYHDEMYLFRIVQNLVSNAIKAAIEAVPEEWKSGEDEDAIYDQVTVRYFYRDGWHNVEVEDHGLGMSQETAERILSGNARSVWSKNTGSGWGTKIVLELAETHNAKVSIDSEIGRGSIFRVSFPHCEGPEPGA